MKQAAIHMCSQTQTILHKKPSFPHVLDTGYLSSCMSSFRLTVTEVASTPFSIISTLRCKADGSALVEEGWEPQFKFSAPTKHSRCSFMNL